jgi:hypothetical protein
MDKDTKITRFFSEVEWRWSLAHMFWGVPAAVASFAVPAWAVSATKALDGYAPISWVLAGFAGLLVASISYHFVSKAFARRVRTRYDVRMLAQGGAIDPLEKTFERKRIYLNEFCLPSHPYVENKTFIDCEIIGPACILFVSGNQISEGKYPIVDAVYLKEGASPFSAYLFNNCIFRGCNFSRVTYLVAHGETSMFKDYALVRWLTQSPYDAPDQMLTLPAVPASRVESGGDQVDRQAPNSGPSSSG